MPVNLNLPLSAGLFPVAGVRLGVAAANIKQPGRQDLLVMALDEGTRVAGLFTRNRFCAAPVTVSREHLGAAGEIRGLVVNSGNANAGTGAEGLAHARRTCRDLAALLGSEPAQVLPFSTGVIMEPLPVDRIVGALPAAVADLRVDNWLNAAQAIMTTDTLPKAVSRQIELDGATVTVTGIAKGSGMIHPNMATMLAFIATDAALAQPLLDDALRYAVERSFNRITVDGDTSTNDACMLLASGAADMAQIDDAASREFIALRAAITEVALHLAQSIVRDGEGATKFISVVVEGGQDAQECSKVAYAVARSPLVKTAFFASDPNMGRILAAIGYAGIADLEVERVKLYLDDVLVAENGGRAAGYREEDGQRVMRQEEITVRAVLGRGTASSTVWTCDLSYDYVKINAEYRS